MNKKNETYEKTNYLNVLLKEYEMSRMEINNHFDREIQIFMITISALGIIYGIIFSQGIYDLVYFIPVLIYPLYCRYRHSVYSNSVINAYLIKIEDQIKKLIQNKEWTGWNHFWKDENKKKGREGFIKRYTVLSRCLIFILIPGGISSLYALTLCISYFFNYNSIFRFTKLPYPFVHLILFIFYTYIILKTLFSYYRKEPRGLIYLIREFGI